MVDSVSIFVGEELIVGNFKRENLIIVRNEEGWFVLNDSGEWVRSDGVYCSEKILDAQQNIQRIQSRPQGN